MHPAPSRSLGLVPLLLLSACRSNPSPPRPAPGPPELGEARVESGVYWGSPLSGPTAGPPPVESQREGSGSDGPDPGAPWDPVRIELWYLRGDLPGDPTPLAPFTGIAADISAVDPWLPSAGLLSSARWFQGAQAESQGTALQEGQLVPATRVARWEGSLPPGATGFVSVVVEETVPDPKDWLGEHDPWGPLEKRVEVHLHHGGRAENPKASSSGELAVSLLVQDLEPRWLHDASELEALDRDAARRRASDPREPGPLRRELVGVTKNLSESEGSQLIVCRSPIVRGEGSHFAAWITSIPDGGSELPSIETTSVEDGLARSAERVLEQRNRWADLDADVLERQRALESLGDATTLRSSLLYLGESCGAPITADFAVVGSQGSLAQVRDRVVPRDHLQADSRGLSQGELARQPKTLGWTLESGTFLVLADELAAGRLDPELQSLLLRHAGEVGRFPGLLRDCALQAQNPEDLRQRLVLENRIFLRDRHPAARVRAHDWLREQGLEIPGYDPLGEAAARRRVLDEDEDRRRSGKNEGSPLGAPGGSEIGERAPSDAPGILEVIR